MSSPSSVGSWSPDIWKSEFIDLLNKPTFAEAKVAQAQALKIHNAPPFVYRYRKFNDFAESELLEGYVWLSHPDDYNDPFDSALLISEEVLLKKFFKARPDFLIDYPTLAPFFTDSERHHAKSSDDPFKTAYEILQAKGALPATISPDEMFRIFMEAAQAANADRRATRYSGLQNTIRITCFCENFSSVLMWSHYAENHTGICIEYATKDLFKNPEIAAFLYPVIYKSERFNSTDHFDPIGVGDVNILLSTLASCHKSPDWSYEKEWRLVMPFDSATTDQKFSLNTLPSRILVGAKVTSANLQKIKELAAKIPVPIVAVGEMSETTFSINFK